MKISRYSLVLIALMALVSGCGPKTKTLIVPGPSVAEHMEGEGERLRSALNRHFKAGDAADDGIYRKALRNEIID